MQAAEGGREGEDLQPGVRGRPRRSTGSSARASRSRCRSKLQHGLFDKLVFSKVRERFGGRVRFFISGAAALNREIAEWFHAAGILILEGYGMTENAAGAIVNHPDDYKFGTVGPGLPGTRGQDRRGRRGPDQGPGRHGRLPQPARGDREDADRRRLAAHRRQGLRSTPTASSRSPAGSRSSSRPPAASTSPRRRSSRSSRRSAPTPASSWCSATSATSCVALVTLDPDAIAGWAAENGMTGRLHRDRRVATQCHDDGRRVRRRAQQPSSTAGRRSRSGSCSTTTSPSSPASSRRR